MVGLRWMPDEEAARNIYACVDGWTTAVLPVMSRVANLIRGCPGGSKLMKLVTCLLIQPGPVIS